VERRSDAGLAEAVVGQARLLRDVASDLGYIEAFRSLKEKELHRLYRLTSRGDADQAPQAMRRAARFLWRERHLRSVRSDDEAEALTVLALTLLRLAKTRGSQRLSAESVRRHRPMSAWWWSATLGYSLLRDDDLIDDKANVLVEWIQTGLPEGDDPPEFARAKVVLASEKNGLGTVAYGRQNAASRFVLSVLLREDPVDFVTAERIDGLLLVEASPRASKHVDPERIEFHHVYPKAFLARSGVARSQQDLIANIAPLSGATNGWISDQAPAEYAGALIREFGQDWVDRMMRSHLLQLQLMRDPEGFVPQIEQRQRTIEQRVRQLLNPRPTDDMV
jgi:hypothetical protein